MSTERLDPTTIPTQQAANDRREGETAGAQGGSEGAVPREATVIVRGETVSDQAAQPPRQDNGQSPNKGTRQDKDKPERKEISAAKSQLQSRLPALDDDADVGVQKDQTVIRDGKADLAFPGTLLASAAPSAAPDGQWLEYRIYETTGGKHVFSKVKRSIFAQDQDTHEADVFDPSPSSMPSQLLRSARDLTRSHPVTWTDAAVGFFGYDPLAKVLYRKFGGQFEEHIG